MWSQLLVPAIFVTAMLLGFVLSYRKPAPQEAEVDRSA